MSPHSMHFVRCKQDYRKPVVLLPTASSARPNMCCMSTVSQRLWQRTMQTRKRAHLLQHYPEDTKGPVSEIWQATRWKELPPDLLTPMCRHKLKDYYVDELAETVTGEYVIPYMWIIREGALCCDARRASFTPKGLQVEKDLVNIHVDKLLHNYLDLKSEGPIMFAGESQGYLERMPNPLRAIANGDELYTSFVFLWADDVGGNRSKLISAHKNIYLMHTNLILIKSLGLCCRRCCVSRLVFRR
ncbi:hypothetical protein JB92DRAFT_1747274 [Gautieria morchelliformis]|nr:hypothetical protein JB92DRAFT_1747274 [Gautieria morchelliformis]